MMPSRMPESCVINIDNAIYGHHGNGKNQKETNGKI